MKAKTMAKQAEFEAKIRRVHDASIRLLIDLNLPTSALSHPSLAKLYEAICHAVDLPTTKVTNWLMSPQEVENHLLYRQHIDNTETAQQSIELIEHESVSEQMTIETPQIGDKRPISDVLPQIEPKRPCNSQTQIVELDDDINERDYVEKFLRTSIEDFLPSRKMGES